MGKCSSDLGYEVASGEHLVPLPIEGTCDYPHISSDFRNVFYRKVRLYPACKRGGVAEPLTHVYSVARGGRGGWWAGWERLALTR